MKISLVFGTRPEVIKLAPLARQARGLGHDVQLVFTGQHRDMVLPLMKFFEIFPDLDLKAMSENQTLSGLSARILSALDQNREKIEADFLVVQGDTTSAFIAAYWAFLHKIPVAHVEAGLRTYDLRAPYPEEANRQLIGRIAQFHFAPTLQSANCLRNEFIRQGVHVVGNTSIDSLLYSLERIRSGEIPPSDKLPEKIQAFIEGHRTILVTAHRRENHGEGVTRICEALRRITAAQPDIRIVYPMHPNPNVHGPVTQLLSENPSILLCNPLPYLAFVEMMDRANVLLTDSGGVQEEGPTLRKPILVMRETTERPEGIKVGFARLVGTDPDAIVNTALRALEDGCTADSENPYGDGRAAERITRILSEAQSLNNAHDVTKESLRTA